MVVLKPLLHLLNLHLYILLLCCVYIIYMAQVHPDVSDAEDAHDVFIELSMIYNVLR
jgi:hypothetical protein